MTMMPQPRPIGHNTPVAGPETVRISEIISALKNGTYDFNIIGDFDGIRQGGPFKEPLGSPGATSVTFRQHHLYNDGGALRFPHGIVPRNDVWARLEHLSRLVKQSNIDGGSPPIVDFEIHRDAIQINSMNIPVMIMPWVEGRSLLTHVRELAENRDTSSLENIVNQLEDFGKQMHVSPFDHGDISGGNLMATDRGELRLIDPDTLRHEDVKDGHIAELGHVSFAHPARSNTKWDEELYRFPLEVIIVTVEALVASPELVESHGNDDGSILFDEEDLKNPPSSKLYDILCNHPVSKLKERAIRLRSANCANSISEANNILGPQHTPMPIPPKPITIMVSPLSGYVQPSNGNSKPKPRRHLPMRIPEAMRKGE